MDSRIASIHIQPLTLPYYFPFATALGKKSVSRNILVTVTLENGLQGYGEGSASLALPQETVENMTRFLKPFQKKLKNQALDEAQAEVKKWWTKSAQHPTALNALEMALWDLEAKMDRRPLYQLFYELFHAADQLRDKPSFAEASEGLVHRSLGEGGNVPPIHKKDRRGFLRQRRIRLWRTTPQIETSLTISTWPSPQASKMARWAVRKKFRILKIKVGSGDTEADLERVRAVAQTAPRCRFILDANQGFTKDSALRFVETLLRERVNVILLEQPVRKKAYRDLKYVGQRSPIPVAVDESVMSVADAQRIVEEDLADVLNLKLAKHGIGQALEIIRLARRAKKELMIGCMAESVIGQSAAVHLACGTGAFTYADLDSHILLKPLAGVSGGFRTAGPILSVNSRRLGTGICLKS